MPARTMLQSLTAAGLIGIVSACATVNPPAATASPISATSTTTPTAAPTFTPTPPLTRTTDLPTAFQGDLPEGAVARLGQGAVTYLQLSPDGARLAVGMSSGVVVFDVATQ